MKNLKITGKDSAAIKCLEESERNGLDKNSVSEAIRVIIDKHNKLVDELQSLKTRNQKLKN